MEDLKTPMEEVKKPTIDQKAYEAHMKNMNRMLKLEWEYYKMKSEIMQFKAMEYKAMEIVASYQGKEKPTEELPLLSQPVETTE